MPRYSWVACAVVAGCVVADPLSAQTPTVRAFTAAPVEFARPFSSISNLLELANGRGLLFDAIERKLGVADLRSGAFTEIASQGAGPREYRVVAAAHRITRDSVLIWDPGNDRILALAPDGTVLGAWRSDGRDSSTTGLARMIPREVDASGRWYVPLRAISAGDTTILVRINARTRQQDTLQRFATPQLRPVRSAAGVVKVRAPGFPPQDAWGVFADGRVLFVHGATYRPELIHPDGTRTQAAPVPFTPLPVTEGDRARHLRDATAELERRLAREFSGGNGGTMPRVEAEPPPAWPSHMPPLRDPVIRVDSRQRAWVLVVDPARGAGDRYDVLDTNGRRVDTVRLPEHVRLVGFGRGALYGAREDDDGLLHLQRYPLPQ